MPRRWRAALLALLLAVLLIGAPASPAAPATASPATQAAAPAAPSAAPAASGAVPAAAPTATVWVTLEGRRVLELRSVAGAQDPAAVARRVEQELQTLVRRPGLDPEAIVVREDPPYAMVGLQGPDGYFIPKLAVDDRAAKAFDLSRQQLAERYRDNLRGAIRQYRSSHSVSAWLEGTAQALLVLGIYLLWLRLQSHLNGRLRRWIDHGRTPWQGGLAIGHSRVLDEEQVRGSLQWLRGALHWSVLALASYLLIPLLLGFFPPTQVLAEGLRSQIRQVVERFLQSLVDAIPNLLTIAVILALTALVIRASNAWFRALERGRLQIPGFYPEWARPTSRLAAVAILLAGVVSAYPYVPGTGSKVFQGAGLFLGILAALGSSAVATNVISGLMLIYTRAFREGDRVDINGVIGIVQDRALLVTRIQTPRNELVSIPNATVIGASILNYSFGRREIQRPVALATTITIGYDVPWRQVHALMLGAARGVANITDDPAPYVLQTSLNDFHISYELNACVGDVTTYRETLSDLLAAIQDRFAEAGVEIMSPNYQAIRNGNSRTVPPWPPGDHPG